MAGPQWKDHPHYIIVQKDLPDLDDLTDTNHPHFSQIFLTSLMKTQKKEKEAKLEFEQAKVQAKNRLIESLQT
jgi:hypothetical protein